MTETAGIQFHHHTGAFILPDSTDSRFMPETMGSGVVVFDCDGDNLQDILFLNGNDFEPSAGLPSTLALYRNLGHWQFSDGTKSAGLDINLYAMGGASADFDGDGDQDILITAIDGLNLFENLGECKFRDITAHAGLWKRSWTNFKLQSGHDWSTGAVFFDADGDFDLDIVSIQYVKWSPEANIQTTYDGTNAGYTSPRSYEGLSPRLWIQDERYFTDQTPNSGLEVEGKSLGIALWDFDGDGKLDIVIANDTQENFLFKNIGDGKFESMAVHAGIAFDGHGNARAGMGIDVGDIDNDGTVAIAIGNFSEEATSLYRQQATWQFQEVGKSAGVFDPTYPLLTFGLSFADLDLDGWQDMVLANGHVEPKVSEVFPQTTYEQPLVWLKNLGNRHFKSMAGYYPPLDFPFVGRGLAVADLDNDGDLDLVATANGGRPRLIRNDLSKAGYLRVRLHGTPPNTNAIGATIVLRGSNVRQRRVVRTGGSYLSQSELVQTFGIPKTETVEALEVTWPDGSKTQIRSPRVNSIVDVHQPVTHPVNRSIR